MVSLLNLSYDCSTLKSLETIGPTQMHFWGVFNLSFHRVVCIEVYQAVKLWKRAPDRSKWRQLVEAAMSCQGRTTL